MYIFLKFEKNQFSKLIMLVIIKFSNSSGSEVTEISNRPFLSGSCSNWNHDQASSRSRWFTSQRVNFGILWRFGQSWVQSLSLISLTLILAVAINYICEKTWNHIKSKLWWWLLMCNWHATWGWPMTSWTDRRTTTYSQCWGPMFRMACWSEHRQSKKVRHERWKIVQGSLHSLEYQSNDHTLGKPDVTICQKALWLQLPVISTIPLLHSQDASIIGHDAQPCHSQAWVSETCPRWSQNRGRWSPTCWATLFHMGVAEPRNKWPEYGLCHGWFESTFGVGR